MGGKERKINKVILKLRLIKFAYGENGMCWVIVVGKKVEVYKMCRYFEGFC